MSNQKSINSIAIQASDLDHLRIDGTRIYLSQILHRLGSLAPQNHFFIYHRENFNPTLTPPSFSNYHFLKIKPWPAWIFTVFSRALWQDRPKVLWMPVQALPIFRRKEMKTVVTIHDLAFRYFPKTFPWLDSWKLRLFSSHAIKNADRIIAISQSTKKDILKFYPQIKEDKIKVIYHGLKAVDYQMECLPGELEDFLKKWNLQKGQYILYVGAIQPRKNLTVLISAFEELAKKGDFSGHLVLAGEKAWLSQETIEKAISSHYSDRIIMTGKLKFGDLRRFYRGGGVFVLPSKYEGFGLPILEAFASGVPVIVADNSSLREIAGEAGLKFSTLDSHDLAEKIKIVLTNEEKRAKMINLGFERVKEFSWDQCAKETLAIFEELSR